MIRCGSRVVNVLDKWKKVEYEVTNRYHIKILDQLAKRRERFDGRQAGIYHWATLRWIKSSEGAKHWGTLIRAFGGLDPAQSKDWPKMSETGDANR